MRTVTLPTGEDADFPDSMSDDDIASALRKLFPAQPQGRRDVTPFKAAPIVEPVNNAGRGVINPPAEFVARQSYSTAKPVAAAPEVLPDYSPSGDDFGSAIMAQERRPTVLELMTNTPATQTPIERRGAPVSEEKFTALKQQYEAATPKERAALMQTPGFESSVFKTIDQQYKKSDTGPTAGLLDMRREARRDAYATQGLNPEAANARATQDAAEGTLPTAFTGLSSFEDNKNFFQKLADKTIPKPMDNSLAGAALETAGDAVRGIASGYLGAATSGWDALYGLAEQTGIAPNFSDLAREAGKAGRESQAGWTNVKDPNSITKSVFESTTQMLMAAGLTRGFGNASIGLASGMSAATAYGDARLAGKNHDEAAENAAVNFAAEYLGEKVALPKLQNVIGRMGGKGTGREFARAVGEMVGTDLAGEQLTTAVEDLYAKFGRGGTRPDMTAADYLDDVIQTFKVTIGQAALMGGGGAAMRGIQKATETPARAFADAFAGDVAGAQFDPAAIDAFARRALDVRSYDAALIKPYQTAKVQQDQTSLQQSTTADAAAAAADSLSGSVDELLVPGNAITPLPLEPTFRVGEMTPSVGRAGPGFDASALTPSGRLIEPGLDLGIPATAGQMIEPTLDLNVPAAEAPGINPATEQQFGLDKLRINAPRPRSIQGTPVDNLSDDQLQAITGDETVAPISRRSAAIELNARQGEAGAFTQRAAPQQTAAPSTVSSTRTMTPEELGAMPIRDRRALASQFDQTENEDGTITFTTKSGVAPSTPAVSIPPLPGTQQTLGTTPVRDVGNQPVLDNETVRADAQRSLDRWAVDNNQAIPAKLNPAPDAETRAVGTIANLLGSQFGTRVLAFHDTQPRAVQGVAVGGTAFVNTANVVTDVSKVSLHELKHTIEQIAFTERQAGLTNTSAQKFTAQIESIFDDITEEGKRAYITNFLHADELAALDSTPDIKESRIQEILQSPVLRSEMTADFMGNRATDKAFWADVAQADPGGFKGFVQKWLSVIDNLMATLRGKPTQGETESAKVDQYVRDLGKAKMVAREALIAYRQGTLQQFESAPAASLRQGEINAPTVTAAGSENLPGPTAQNRPGFSEDGGGPTPAYGTPRAGAISVVGRHYSTTPRQTLSGAYYGQGLKGAERTRLDSSTDPRLKNRVYFYVDQGAGIRPESGVGGYAHETKLDNIYDPQTRLIKPQADANAFESAVINAGFDGYIAPFGNGQSAVVLLGQKHKAVPVKQIGQPRAAALPAEAAPTTLKKGLLTREASQVDTGNIPGSRMRMGTLEIPAGQVEAANTEMERIGSEIRFAKRQAAPARVMFEVAPDPNNLDLNTRWDAVPFERKIEISQRVAAKIMPQVFRLAGVRAKMTTQLGGYLEKTSPSFAAILPSTASAEQLMDVARLGGFGLTQEEMMVLDSKPFEGSSLTGLITITLPENMQDQESVHSVYQAVRQVSPENIKGHTTVGKEMVLAVPSDRMADLVSKIQGALGRRPEGFIINAAEGQSAFVSNKEYDYDSENGNLTPELLAKRTEARRIREEASAAIEAELAADESSGGRKINTGVYRAVAEAFNLSQVEYDATALPLMLGGTKNKTFRAPKIGGIPEVVEWLTNRRLESGLPILNLNKAQDRTTLAKLMASEAVAAIRSAGNAVEWYDETVEKMLRIMAVKYPELNTDPNARNAFLIAVAISSQTMDVESNLTFASSQYEAYRTTGKFPEIGQGKSIPAMTKNFALANRVMADMGPDLLRRFLQTEFTKRELETVGFPIGGESMDEKILGSAIFGPKIGFGFYSNLTGNFEPITMDMWFMRLVGRLTGTLPAFDPVLFPKQVAKLRAALAETGPAESGVYAAQFDPAAVQAAMETDEGAIALARQVNSLHNRQFIKQREAFDSGTRIKTPLVGAAGAILKSADKPRDAPSSGGERQRLRDVTRQMVAMVEQQIGKRVPPAALQALVWYPEQELYKKLGVDLAVTSQDYAGAAKILLTKEGFDGKQIDTAAQPGPGPARQVAGKQNARADGQTGQPTRPTGPLQGAERESFIQARTSLEDVFAGLDKRGLAKTNMESIVARRTDAAQIKYVQENFNDILIQLEDADKVKINCK
jgi:hypothetical protein